MPNPIVQEEDTTRLKRVQKITFDEVSHVDKGGAPGVEAFLIRNDPKEPSLWDKLKARVGISRSADEMPMTTKEIMQAKELHRKAAELEDVFSSSMFRILHFTKGPEQMALLQRTVAEFSDEMEKIASPSEDADMKRSAIDDMARALVANPTPDQLSPEAQMIIERALEPFPVPQHKENTVDTAKFLESLSPEHKTALERHFNKDPKEVTPGGDPSAQVTPEASVEVERKDPEAKAPEAQVDPKDAQIEELTRKLAEQATAEPNKALTTIIERLEAKVDAMSTAKDTDEITVLARSYDGIGQTQEEIIKDLSEAKKAGDSVFEMVKRNFATAKTHATATAGAYFSEIGSSERLTQTNPDSATAEISRKAAKLIEEGKFDHAPDPVTQTAMARAAVGKADTDLRKRAAAEQKTAQAGLTS